MLFRRREYSGNNVFRSSGNDAIILLVCEVIVQS